jgi:predicted transposase/invertase (TIGR01784 family)
MPLSAKRPLISFDWAIKRLLRQKANYEILEGFLSELLRQDVVVKAIHESESNKANAASKYNRVDILCDNYKGELLLIELQFYPEMDFLHRMLFGTSKLITDYMKEGTPFENVKKVYSINIVYFDLGQGTDYVYYGKTAFYGLHHQDELKMPAAQQKKLQKEHIHQIFPEYYIIKVNNFDDIAKDTLDEWIYYLKNNLLPDRFKAKGLDKVEAKLKLEAMTPEERKEYKDYHDNLVISQNMLDTARWEGLFEGEKKGEVKGEIKGMTKANRNFAEYLISNSDFSDAKIATLVGVDEAWVAAIRKELEK